MPLVRRAARVLGLAISDAVSLLNPSLVVVGGLLTLADEPLLAGIREVVYRRSLPLATRNLQITVSRLGEAAATTGLTLMLGDRVFAPEVIDAQLGDREALQRQRGKCCERSHERQRRVRQQPAASQVQIRQGAQPAQRAQALIVGEDLGTVEPWVRDYLSRRGILGTSVLWFEAGMQGEPLDVGVMTRGLGEDWHALGTAIKPYPCCRFEHGAIDLAIQAHADGVAPGEVQAVAIRIYRTDVLSYHREPKNPVDAQFNVPYGVAVALVRGRVALADFTDAAIRDETVLAVSRRVDVVEDAEYSARYPQDYWIEMKIRLRDGGVLQGALNFVDLAIDGLEGTTGLVLGVDDQRHQHFLLRHRCSTPRP